MERRNCTKCERILPVSCFHKHKKCKGGYNSVCKSCRKPISAKQYKETSLEYRLWCSAKYRAKKRGLPFNIEICDIDIPLECPILRVPLEVKTEYAPSLDRNAYNPLL